MKNIEHLAVLLTESDVTILTQESVKEAENSDEQLNNLKVSLRPRSIIKNPFRILGKVNNSIVQFPSKFHHALKSIVP